MLAGVPLICVWGIGAGVRNPSSKSVHAFEP